jgi:hypothetical protein
MYTHGAPHARTWAQLSHPDCLLPACIYSKRPPPGGPPLSLSKSDDTAPRAPPALALLAGHPHAFGLQRTAVWSVLFVVLLVDTAITAFIIFRIREVRRIQSQLT